MKNFNTLTAHTRAIACIFMMICAMPGITQTDTLHIFYHATKIELHDTSDAKIDQWIKGLNGKHVELEVVAYFHKPEFKKYATERADEMFLILNRKAREQFTIKSVGAKKGKNYQRTTVDIIYTASLTQAEKDKAAAELKAEEEKKKAAKKAKDEEADNARKVAKEKESSEKGTKKTTGTDTVEKSGDKKKKQNDKGSGEKVTSKGKKDAKEGKNEDGEKNEKDSKTRPNSRDIAGAYSISTEEVALIKNSKIIVGTYSKVDSMLLRAVRDFWTFNKNITTMPYSDAIELAKTDKSVIVMYVTTVRSQGVTRTEKAGLAATAVKAAAEKAKNAIAEEISPTALEGEKKWVTAGGWSRARVSYSQGLVLEKGKRKMVAAVFMPPLGKTKYEFTPEAVVFAVSVMNSLLINMDEQKLPKYKRMNAPFEKKSEELKYNTLLIPDNWLDKKTTSKEVSENYHAKFEVVDYETFKDAILTKKKVAYVMPVPFASGGQLRFYDYLMNAETGMVYYIHQPPILVQGVKVRNPLGGTFDLAHSEKISAKNIANYNKAFEKKKEDEKDGNKKEKKPKEKEPTDKKKSKSDKKPGSDSTETE